MVRAAALREYLLDLHLIIITSWSFFYLLELVMNGVGREKRPRGCAATGSHSRDEAPPLPRCARAPSQNILSL